ncbi:hypothetical protein J4465_01475 [Candidatus Pacearchaeota archaeon]|nr:hypothetical protein [Candidatus Pacearchaeota archaeon]
MKKIQKNDELLFNLLKETIRKVAGKTAEPLVDVLFNKKNVNEFKIAGELKLTINQTRNILYRISNFNLLNSTRKKDEKKGWYTYFWTLNFEKSLGLLLKLKEQELATFENILKSRLTKNFYICQNDDIEMSEETAMHHNFFCPECGELLQLVSEEKKTKEFAIKIVDIQKQIEIIRIELEKITPKPIIEVKKVKKKVKKEKQKAKKDEKIEKKVKKNIKKITRVKTQVKKAKSKVKPKAKTKKKMITSSKKTKKKKK